MAKVFTLEMVQERLSHLKLGGAGSEAELRFRLAKYVEEVLCNPVEAQEIRTGKPYREVAVKSHKKSHTLAACLL